MKYKIDTRIITGTPCLVIDCSTKTKINKTCLYFLHKGFNLIDRFVAVEKDDGYRKLVGKIVAVDGEEIQITSLDGGVEKIHADKIYLEASRKNFDDYISHTHASQRDAISEKIRRAISSFNGGENKNKRINTLKKYLQDKGISLIDPKKIS